MDDGKLIRQYTAHAIQQANKLKVRVWLKGEAEPTPERLAKSREENIKEFKENFIKFIGQSNPPMR